RFGHSRFNLQVLQRLGCFTCILETFSGDKVFQGWVLDAVVPCGLRATFLSCWWCCVCRRRRLFTAGAAFCTTISCLLTQQTSKKPTFIQYVHSHAPCFG